MILLTVHQKHVAEFLSELKNNFGWEPVEQQEKGKVFLLKFNPPPGGMRQFRKFRAWHNEFGDTHPLTKKEEAEWLAGPQA